MKYIATFVLACVVLASCPGTVFGQNQEDKLKGKLAGKVSSLIPRTRRAVVVGKKRDFRRLIKDTEQHDALMAKLSQPVDFDSRERAYEQKLNRYGAAKSQTRAILTDFGTEADESRPRKKVVSAKEPEEDSSDSTWLVLLGILAGSGIVIMRARNS